MSDPIGYRRWAIAEGHPRDDGDESACILNATDERPTSRSPCSSPTATRGPYELVVPGAATLRIRFDDLERPRADSARDGVLVRDRVRRAGRRPAHARGAERPPAPSPTPATDREGATQCPRPLPPTCFPASREWGVKRVFGYPGDGINGLMGASHEHEDSSSSSRCRHEEIAAFAACAHAKVTGEVGVCMATSGPGAIHLLNGLYDAKLDHQPVVAIVGQQKRIVARRQLPAGSRPRHAVQGRRRTSTCTSAWRRRRRAI